MTRIQLLGYSLSPQDMPSKSYGQWTFLCIPYDWLCLCTRYILLWCFEGKLFDAENFNSL